MLMQGANASGSAAQPAKPEMHVTKTEPPLLWCEARATPKPSPRASKLFTDDTDGTAPLHVLLENLSRKFLFGKVLNIVATRLIVTYLQNL